MLPPLLGSWTPTGLRGSYVIPSSLPHGAAVGSETGIPTCYIPLFLGFGHRPLKTRQRPNLTVYSCDPGIREVQAQPPGTEAFPGSGSFCVRSFIC